MTLADNLASDVTTIISAAEFAEAVTLQPAGGGSTAGLGDFQRDQPMELQGDEGTFAIYEGTLSVSEAVFSAIAEGDTFVIDSQTWRVFEEPRLEHDLWTVRVTRVPDPPTRRASGSRKDRL